MRLGQSRCLYCGHLMSSDIHEWTEHVENCNKNPDNWEEDTSWIEFIEDED